MCNFSYHQPVLMAEVLMALKIDPAGIYIDATFGRGGHTRAILHHLAPSGQVLAFDQDPEAVEFGQMLSQQDSRFTIIHGTFSRLKTEIEKRGLLKQVQGVLLDLGVSSPQLENHTRGFSFLREGPLDMRMNPNEGQSIQSWLSQASVTEITKILKTYGEERFAKRIAHAIIKARQQAPLTTTTQLAKIIATAHPAWEKDKHPATRSFQALRIFINRELEQLQQVLPQILDILAPKGRLAVISFHSLEDRIVKRFIRDCVRGDDFPSEIPITAAALRPRLQSIGKPIYPSAEEVANNPRARSAILRIAQCF
jgi:16S rRNA (cytosine1402-N4)-methyltransferase